MRIAPELYLKRLLVGGFERVYEINRNFRNEGLSRQHNPEFTMLEFYMAYATYEHLIELTEELIVGLADELVGKRQLHWDGADLDLLRPWRRVSVRDAVVAERDVPEDLFDDPAVAAEVAIARGVAPSEVLRALAEGLDPEELSAPRSRRPQRPLRGVFDRFRAPADRRSGSSTAIPTSSLLGSAPATSAISSSRSL